MKRSTVVAVGVVAVLGGLFILRRTTSIFSGGGSNQVTVQLNIDATDGICKAANPLPAGGAWLHRITWTVTNNCRADQYVAFLEYRERLDGGGLSPTPDNIINPDPANSPVIAPAAAVPVDARVRRFYFRFRDTTFKYKICVGTAANPTTNCLDPDFDVWPF